MMNANRNTCETAKCESPDTQTPSCASSPSSSEGNIGNATQFARAARGSVGDSNHIRVECVTQMGTHKCPTDHLGGRTTGRVCDYAVFGVCRTILASYATCACKQTFAHTFASVFHLVAVARRAAHPTCRGVWQRGSALEAHCKQLR